METPFVRRLSNAVHRVYCLTRNRLTRPPRPQPDLTHEDAEIVTLSLQGIHADGNESPAVERESVIFTRYPMDRAVREGWATKLHEYEFLAHAAFALRYPNHPMARQFRHLTPDFSEGQLLSILRGNVTISRPRIGPTDAVRALPVAAFLLVYGSALYGLLTLLGFPFPPLWRVGCSVLAAVIVYALTARTPR